MFTIQPRLHVKHRYSTGMINRFWDVTLLCSTPTARSGIPDVPQIGGLSWRRFDTVYLQTMPDKGERGWEGPSILLLIQIIGDALRLKRFSVQPRGDIARTDPWA